MLRTVPMAERSVDCSAPLLVVVAANSTTNGSTLQPPDTNTYNGTQIVPDYSQRPMVEVQLRHIQNLSTTNNCFIAINQDGCDGTVNFHYILAPLQVLDVSNHLCKIWAFCSGSGGTTISYVEYLRNDGVTGVTTNPLPNH